MHYLHKILVHVPSAIRVDEDTTHDEILKAVIRYAREETERFYEKAYDWREDDSAGRWAEEYPQQAYLTSDDLAWFIAELEEVLKCQKAEIDACFAQLSESVGTDLAQIVEGLWNRDDHDFSAKQTFSCMTAYYLRVIAEILYGEYRIDSYFYNTHEYTARLYPSDLDVIKEKPEEWALVMFDYHF